MARLFALADLHLSLAGHKPMDLFGEVWRDHPQRMAVAWDARVGPEDVVLLPGDLSWARNPVEAAPDLAWLAARPGRKLLLRGNHDSWWTSLSRLSRILPPDCVPLQNNAVRVDGRIVLGARGWISPDDPAATPNDIAVYRRELERLRLAIHHADNTFGRELPRVAMTHFPPQILGQELTPVVRLLQQAGVSVCVYGHLHGADHALAIRGLHEGIRFYFVAADAVDFAPQEIPVEAP